MNRRLAALWRAGTVRSAGIAGVALLVACAIAGCGRYGPPKRIPQAIEANEPAPEDERPPEPSVPTEAIEPRDPAV